MRHFHSIIRLARDNLPKNDDGTYGEITTVRMSVGPETSLSPDLEEKIRLYIEDCHRIGLS